MGILAWMTWGSRRSKPLGAALLPRYVMRARSCQAAAALTTRSKPARNKLAQSRESSGPRNTQGECTQVNASLGLQG